VIPVPAVRPTKSELKNAVDWVGGTTITIALCALLFAMTQGNVVGWGTWYIGFIIGVSAILITMFVAWQLHLEKRTTQWPLMKVTLFKDLRVSAAMFTMALFFASFNNFLIYATFYYQDYKGRDAIETTIRFLPTGVGGSTQSFQCPSSIAAELTVMQS